MLTRSDLRWMEDQRRRAALRRMLEADDRELAGIGLRRGEVEETRDLPAGTDLCARARTRPALARRLGCR